MIHNRKIYKKLRDRGVSKDCLKCLFETFWKQYIRYWPKMSSVQILWKKSFLPLLDTNYFMLQDWREILRLDWWRSAAGHNSRISHSLLGHRDAASRALSLSSGESFNALLVALSPFLFTFSSSRLAILERMKIQNGILQSHSGSHGSLRSLRLFLRAGLRLRETLFSSVNIQR
jgi:hypothetical protein